MAEAVPVGARLEAELDGVIAGVEQVRVAVGVHALVDHQHGPGRVVAAGDESDLDPVVLEWHGQEEGAAGADAVPGGQHHLRRDQVEGAEFVVVTPAAPVAHPAL